MTTRAVIGNGRRPQQRTVKHRSTIAAAWMFLAPAAVSTAVWATACGSDETTVPGSDGPVGSDTFTPDPDAGVSDDATPPQPATLEEVGLSSAALDPKADPCQDFYQYACGGWIEATTIPDDQPGWFRGFSELEKRNEEFMKTVLDQAAQNTTSTNPVDQAIGAYYGGCMDTAAIEQAALSGLQPLLDQARQLATPADITKYLAKMNLAYVDALFYLSAEPDLKNPKEVILNMQQWGLGLGDRDRYLDESQEMKELRATYVGHVERMLALGGLDATEAKQAADNVLAFETEVAKAWLPWVDLYDVEKSYNKVDRAGLKQIAPSIDWDAYFAALGYPNIQAISISDKDYFATIEALVKTQSMTAWSHYFQWYLLHNMTRYLPQTFVDESLVLRKALYGVEESEDRWKRCLEDTIWAMPHYTGQAFVKAKFPDATKQQALTMLDGIRQAFSTQVAKLDWMDDATRTAALDKLKLMEDLIGFPNKWRSYDYKLDKKQFTQTELLVRDQLVRDQLERVGKPVDRAEWDIPPSLVNAFYNGNKNLMFFPAGILQPPFFSSTAATAVNHGAIGMVMGHELTHGFDSEGAKLDGTGLLDDWWSEATKTTFEKKTQCVADYFSNTFEWLPDVPVDGQQLLQESVADMGGMKLAFHAYRHAREGKAPLKIEGDFTEDQLFFLSVGQIWCAKYRDEVLQSNSQDAVHPPAWARVNGPLANFAEFANAFQCAADTPMNPADRCEVW